MRFPVLSLCAVLSLAMATSCATGPPPNDLSDLSDEELQELVDENNAQAAGKKEQVVCVTERPVGSHFERRICRTVHQAEQDLEAAQDDVRHRPSPAQTGEGGGP